MSVQDLYEEVMDSLPYIMEVKDFTEVYEYPEEKMTYDYPGSDYYAEICGEFVITISREKIGKLTDESWRELTEYVRSKTEEMQTDEDFKDIYGDSLKAYVCANRKYKNYLGGDICNIVDNFIENEFYTIEFNVEKDKWVIHLEYK